VVKESDKAAVWICGFVKQSCVQLMGLNRSTNSQVLGPVNIELALGSDIV
jgi:hypothetical protein